MTEHEIDMATRNELASLCEQCLLRLNDGDYPLLRASLREALGIN